MTSEQARAKNRAISISSRPINRVMCWIQPVFGSASGDNRRLKIFIDFIFSHLESTQIATRKSHQLAKESPIKYATRRNPQQNPYADRKFGRE
jgi:hypothetical protein